MAKESKESKKRGRTKRNKFLDGLSSSQAEPNLFGRQKRKSVGRVEGEANNGTNKETDNLIKDGDYEPFLFSAENKGFFDSENNKGRDRSRLKKSIFYLASNISFAKVVSVCFLSFFLAGGWSLYSQADSLGGEIKGATYQGKNHLTKARVAVDNYDLLTASEEFKLASNEIGKASDKLIREGQFTPYWNQLPYTTQQSAMVSSVILIDRTITSMSGLYNQLLDLTDRADFGPKRQKKLLVELSNLERDLGLLKAKIGSLNKSKYFYPSEIEAYNKDIGLLRDQIVLIREFTQQSPKLFGYDKEKKYLLLFQNNAEPRPTGGFVGTFGYLTVKDGRIADLFVDEIYGPRDRLRATKLDRIKASELGYPEGFPTELIPNEPIRQEYLHSFYVHNTNVTPDFPESARRALWSFENVLEQPSASELISINPNVIENILEITGPIEVGEHGVKLDASNFRDIVQYKVEVDNPFKKDDQEDYNPKQILVDFTPKMLDAINSLSLEDKLKVFASILDQAKSKHILAYSQDQSLKNLISSYEIDGRVDQSESDYLQVNLDAFNATKSGLFLERDIQLMTRLGESGQVKHNLEISLTNMADGRQKYYSDIELMVRVMVPYGSDLSDVLIGSKEITETVETITESGKTVYLVPIEVEEKGRKVINLNYKSQYLLDDEKGYKFIYQAQPGSIKTDFNWQFNSPEYSQITNYSPKSLNFVDQSTLGYSQKNINQDLKVVLEFLP